MWKRFLRLLESRPLLTQCVTSGIIGGMGDAISQTVVERRTWKEYDVSRTNRFVLITGIYIAPCLAAWFRLLERVRGATKIIPLKKVALDQLLFAPPFSATIIYNLRLLEGQSLKRSWESLKRDFIGIYACSLAFWPGIQLFNFYFVPLHFRVILVQIAALLWNTFLSYRTQAYPKRHLKLED
ncbi:hypothetical protein AB6A40_003898 [Gnathostoma spinigerum]|uniref:Mitochondrial inner membrane protein Mpv17 n=1 Tax=Gnathostoma spinigerum TaxID=75299 RepID=A0ABD6EAW4_9BILA